MNKYKLCRVMTTGTCVVRPIDEKGHDAGDVIVTNEDDGTYYYAIYENIGTEGEPDWDEWGYYDQDLEGAVEEFNKLKEN